MIYNLLVPPDASSLETRFESKLRTIDSCSSSGPDVSDSVCEFDATDFLWPIPFGSTKGGFEQNEELEIRADRQDVGREFASVGGAKNVSLGSRISRYLDTMRTERK